MLVMINFEDTLDTVEKQKCFWEHMADQHHCIVCSVHAVGSISSGPSGPFGCGFYNCGGLKTLAENIAQRHSLEIEVGRPMKTEKLGDRVAVTDAVKVIIVKPQTLTTC